MDSILNSVKAMLSGIEANYTDFDTELIMFINSALSDIRLLGVGPNTGFKITSATEKWSDLLGDDEDLMQNVPEIVYLKTKLVFDPPSNSFTIAMIEDKIKKLEWLLTVIHDETRGDTA